MAGIFRGLWGRASWLCLAAAACGGARTPAGSGPAGPVGARVVPLSEAIVLETAGPPPSDTTVIFTAGEPRVIVLRHGPPEYIVFAELSFPAPAFAERGSEVRVEVRPRPGVYGLEVITSLPIRDSASLSFKYPRYFAAPSRARAVYGSDAAYERALAVGRMVPEGLLALLASTRPYHDVLRAPLPAAGTYLVAAPQ
ncbi:MAG TPA: hypothetical protein VHG35_06455 [Gemmatimonadales bacterium]|nr:hypothetical protein [Gemmatimonadales bacterium]